MTMALLNAKTKSVAYETIVLEDDRFALLETDGRAKSLAGCQSLKARNTWKNRLADPAF
ncbi:MAG: hypothetical protein MZU97_22270 [Bacillus subtilis]|nr:hypothetical protein [Bacillus subtilis]